MDELVCPILVKSSADPVITENGFTYEKRQYKSGLTNQNLTSNRTLFKYKKTNTKFYSQNLINKIKMMSS